MRRNDFDPVQDFFKKKSKNGITSFIRVFLNSLNISSRSTYEKIAEHFQNYRDERPIEEILLNYFHDFHEEG